MAIGMSDDLLYSINKTKDDVNSLLALHKRLVYHMLKETNQLNNQDAESAAWQGLWDAIVTFDVFSKTEFSSYACVVIKNAINGELRKHYQKKQPVHILLEDVSCYIIKDVDTGVELAYNCDVIYTLFDAYIVDKTGIVKNILLAWYSSDFESTPTNIAKICNCAPTNVSRVQATFRAYITRRLGEL